MSKEKLDKQKTVLQKSLSQGNWEQLTTEQKKIEAKHLGSYIQAVLRMPPSSVPITFETLPAGQTGGYDTATNSISLSNELLSKNKKDDLINTLFHEIRHAYQTAVAKNPNQYPKENQAQVAKWRENQPPSYMSGNYNSQDKHMYIAQAIERDAFQYGDNMTEDFYNAKVFDAERPNYENRKIFWTDQENRWETLAKQALGDDYIRKTDIRVKNDYLRNRSLSISATVLLDGNILQEDKQQYNKLCNEILAEKSPTISELKNMNELEMKNKEKRLVELDQQLVAFQKKWEENIDSKIHSQSTARSEMSPTSTLGNDVNITASLPLNGMDHKLDQTTSIQISELRSTLNNRMDEITAQKKEISMERYGVEGPPMTKPQADKLASSDYVKGEDKQLDQQANELQIKRDKLSVYEKDAIAFGKEHGLDKTIWRHAPEIFKGEGLKNYESSLAIVEKNNKAYDRQGTEIKAKSEQLQERLNTPEARVEIAKKSEEYLAQDKERLVKLEPLDRKFNDLNKEQNSIIDLKNAMPTRNLDRTMNLQGDIKDAKNLLQQTDQIKKQTSEMQQSMGRSRSR